jgi:alkylation response protein AidB-like acyl-CoA dehydrogenase
MPSYRAPVTDYRFLLTEVFDVGRLTKYAPYAEATPDVLMSVLEEGGKWCEEVLFPLNMNADAEGCTWNAGAVTTPKGYKEAYRDYCQAGWLGLSCDPEHGGQGLPLTMRFAIDEMLCSASLGFSGYPGLTNGVYEGLHTHGTEEQKKFYLPRLTSGEWSGTMCLTEAHAGTDLGMIRSTAVPVDDGSYRVTGTKIFITAGEHDLAENVIHLVLAKLPGAAAGTRGISMFLIPKFLPNADGSLGARNAVSCGSIEHKMGLKGSATCVLNFDGATGWLVGEPNKGMRAMFTLMNGARLGVGLQGLGLAEVSYQNAVAYARERQQGRALSGVKESDAPADRIVHHADVRRGLLWMRAFTEGARALAVWTGMLIDDELRSTDQSTREEASELVALMTPVVKAFFTDLGFTATNIGLQTFGGHGYIRESGMEQYVRDARIGQIYEGTNYVQAIDLVGRKLSEGNGRLFNRYAAVLQDELTAWGQDAELSGLARPIAGAVEKLKEAAQSLAQRSAVNPDEAGAAATEFLHLFGYVAFGHMWLRQARIAREKLASGGGEMGAAFYEAKVGTARFFVERMLPQVDALFAAIMAGAQSTMEFDEDRF